MMFLRLLVFLVYAAVAVIVLLSVCNLWQNRFPLNSTQSPASRRIFNNFSSFRIPAVLFPPSALISLTDDNATFFVARPAAFGPLLPENGLNGRLWAASASREHISESAENLDSIDGELGCSDIPGWNGLTSNVKESIENHDELWRNSDDGLQSEEKHDAKDGQASQVFAQDYYIHEGETNDNFFYANRVTEASISKSYSKVNQKNLHYTPVSNLLKRVPKFLAKSFFSAEGAADLSRK